MTHCSVCARSPAERTTFVHQSRVNIACSRAPCSVVRSHREFSATSIPRGLPNDRAAVTWLNQQRHVQSLSHGNFRQFGSHAQLRRGWDCGQPVNSTWLLVVATRGQCDLQFADICSGSPTFQFVINEFANEEPLRFRTLKQSTLSCWRSDATTSRTLTWHLHVPCSHSASSGIAYAVWRDHSRGKCLRHPWQWVTQCDKAAECTSVAPTSTTRPNPSSTELPTMRAREEESGRVSSKRARLRESHHRANWELSLSDGHIICLPLLRSLHVSSLRWLARSSCDWTTRIRV